MTKPKKSKAIKKHKSKPVQFNLQNISEPNLYKEMFPYSEVGRIVFDHKVLKTKPAKDIFITDTTFRDGQQARPPYTAQQIVQLYKFLSEL